MTVSYYFIQNKTSENIRQSNTDMVVIGGCAFVGYVNLRWRCEKKFPMYKQNGERKGMSNNGSKAIGIDPLGWYKMFVLMSIRITDDHILSLWGI